MVLIECMKQVLPNLRLKNHVRQTIKKERAAINVEARDGIVLFLFFYFLSRGAKYEY